MDRILELRQKIEAKATEVRTLLEGNKVEEARNLMTEINGLKETLKIYEDLEADEKRSLENQRNKNAAGGAGINETNEFRSIVKHVLGQEMSAEERANITTADNSAVVPKQFVNKLIEIQKGFGSLKGICDEIPVTKNEGTIPVVDLDQNELMDIAEGEDIVDGTLVTTDVSYKCKKVGLIQSLASELLDDAEVEIENLVNSNFANIATVKENVKILSVIKAHATAVEGATGYEDIQKAIDKSLPSVKMGLRTITNVTTYADIKNKKDLEGRPLNLITIVNGVETFHGKPIHVVEDEMLPLTEESGTNFIAYIANTKEAIKFIDRKAVTIAKSSEAGFKDDTKKIRILERFDVIKGSARSIKKIEY